MRAGEGRRRPWPWLEGRPLRPLPASCRCAAAADPLLHAARRQPQPRRRAARCRRIYMGVERLLARRTDVLLFESAFIADRFRERVGDRDAPGPRRPQRHQRGRVRAGARRAGRGRLRLCRRAALAKGIDTLIDAIGDAVAPRSDAASSSILVGSGPDQAQLEAQARKRGIADQVSFPGRDAGARRPSRSAARSWSRAAPNRCPTSCSRRPARSPDDRDRRRRHPRDLRPLSRPADRLRRPARAGDGAWSACSRPTPRRSRRQAEELAAFVASALLDRHHGRRRDRRLPRRDRGAAQPGAGPRSRSRRPLRPTPSRNAVARVTSWPRFSAERSASVDVARAAPAATRRTRTPASSTRSPRSMAPASRAPHYLGDDPGGPRAARRVRPDLMTAGLVDLLRRRRRRSLGLSSCRCSRSRSSRPASSS